MEIVSGSRFLLRKETDDMNFIEYVKQLWKNGPGGGTPWSASRLNHMEDGIKNNNSMISELNNNIIETMGSNGISSGNSINMDSELFSSHKPLYIHAIRDRFKFCVNVKN